MRPRADVRRALRRRAGISLFESLAAMAIVGTITMSALAAVAAGFRTAEKARRVIEAEALATQRIDQLDLLSDLELQTLPDTVAEGQFDPPLDEYTWVMTSEPYATQAGVYTIALDIKWSSGNYRVNSYAYRRPVITTRNR